MSEFRTRQLLSPKDHLLRTGKKRSIYLNVSSTSSMCIRDYVQVQRKKIRSMMIMDTFHRTNTSLKNCTDNTIKGFRGGKVNRKKFVHKSKFEEIDPNPKQFESQSSLGMPIKQHKPNLMYNLTLYRKSFRERTSSIHNVLRYDADPKLMVQNQPEPAKRSKTTSWT